MKESFSIDDNSRNVLRESLLKKRASIRKRINSLEKEWNNLIKDRDRISFTMEGIKKEHNIFCYNIFYNLLNDASIFSEQWERNLLFNTISTIIDEVNKPLRNTIEKISRLKEERKECVMKITNIRSDIDMLNNEIEAIRIELYEIEKPETFKR